ncbi:MAG: sigma-70 family RNA polymerase sigma factor [Ruminococcus sp.]|nr:sigma-70 family RNA polymerase sigma factor [Ruminococcus sp.]
MNTNIMDTANTAMLNEKITLRELLDITATTAGHPLPTPKALRLSVSPVAVYTTHDFSMIVYENGFVVAHNAKRHTVFHLDRCKDYHYNTAHEDTARQKNSATKPDIRFEEFLDMPWTVRVMLTAEDRLEENNNTAEQRRMSEHPQIAADVKQYNKWRYGESVEDIVIGRIMQEEVIEKLTDKQREVFDLYYREGYTLDEVGRTLGIGRKSVSDRLEVALKKIRKSVHPGDVRK